MPCLVYLCSVWICGAGITRKTLHIAVKCLSLSCFPVLPHFTFRMAKSANLNHIASYVLASYTCFSHSIILFYKLLFHQHSYTSLVNHPKLRLMPLVRTTVMPVIIALYTLPSQLLQTSSKLWSYWSSIYLLMFCMTWCSFVISKRHSKTILSLFVYIMLLPSSIEMPLITVITADIAMKLLISLFSF